MHNTEKTKHVELLSVGQLFEELESKTSKKRILLTGNGFNRAFGYETGYKALFEIMKGEDPDNYKGKFQKKLEGCGYDIEKILKEYAEKTHEKKTGETPNLSSLAQKCIKMDFLKALVKQIRAGGKIKSMPLFVGKQIGAGESTIRGMSLFIGDFDYVFTLNFDFLLYKAALLLGDKAELNESLKEIVRRAEEHLEGLGDFSPPEIRGETPGRPNAHVRYGDLEEKTKIKMLTDILSKEWRMFVPEKSKRKALDKEVREIIMSGIIMSGEKTIHGKRFSPNDGFLSEGKSKKQCVWKEKNRKEQNLFYLHGALHIFKEGRGESVPIQKLTVRSEGTLADQIQGHVVRNSAIACVFKGKDKEQEIQESLYLRACLDRLKKIEGVLVIHGSDFGGNDDHIWKAIRDNSGIKEVYVSLYKEGEQEAEKRARAKEKLNGGAGGDKKIILFDGDVPASVWFERQKQLEEDAKKDGPASQPSP